MPGISPHCSAARTRPLPPSWHTAKKRAHTHTHIHACTAAKACKIDAEKFCNVTWFFGYKSGQIVSCLRDVKNQVSKNCRVQIFKVQMDVSAGQGWCVCVCVYVCVCVCVLGLPFTTHACAHCTRACPAQACTHTYPPPHTHTPHTRTQAAQDMRSDPMLWEACKEDSDNLCKDVKPGGGRMQACLVRILRIHLHTQSAHIKQAQRAPTAFMDSLHAQHL